VRALWPLVNDLEITMEANPTSVEAEKLKAFKEAGVTRVSLGVQALNDTDLEFLGRKHSAADAIRAIENAAENFEHFSFDLIYARPGQTLEGWKEELKRAAALASGGHLSLYQLTIERNTPFYYDAAQGLFSLPDDGQGAAFYHATQEVLDAANLPAYEVSNHAAPGRESRHNLTYWHYGDYIGIGPGAHGRLSVEGQKLATREHYAPQKWLEMVEREGRGAHPFQPLSHEERFCEALMMGLRLYEGVALDHLQAQSGGRDWREYIDAARIETARGEGWLDIRDGRMVLSREGMLRLNALIPYILKDPSRPAQKERAV
jgi:oxygen-independent coproporphyrinogen-3 oxidase